LLALLGAVLAIAFPEAAIAFVIGVLILVPTHNIFYAAGVGFASMLALSVAFGRPPEITYFIFGTWCVVFLAGLPETLQKFMTPGAIRDYFRDPDRIYREEAVKRRR
jgi:hypothetical protein